MSFTLRQVVGSGVMNSVASLPGEIRYKEDGVENITNGILAKSNHAQVTVYLKQLVVREGTVSALVSNDPNTSGDSASHDSIGKPKGNGQEGQRDEVATNEETQKCQRNG